MTSIIQSACDIPLNQINGDVPDVSGALMSYFQPMTFVPVQRTVTGFQVIENARPIEFRGTIQPFTPRQLALKPEGDRAWSWYTVFAQPGVALNVADCIEYRGRQYRVMSKTNLSLYGVLKFDVVEDWRGVGP